MDLTHSIFILKYYTLSLLSFLFVGFAFAQVPNNNSFKDSIDELLDLSTETMYTYEYNRTIQYSLDLIELAEKNKEYYYLYHAYNNLGITYEDLKDSIRAEHNYKKALEYAIIVKNDTLLWWAYNNLGNIYTENDATVEKGFRYYNKAIEISTRMQDPESNVTPLINKGWTHLDMKQYDKAYPYLVQVDSLSADMTDPFLQSQLAYLFGRYYAGKDEFEKSRCAFTEAITAAEKDFLFHEASVAYQEYAKLLYDHENFEAAYQAMEQHLAYEGKIYEAEKLEQREAAYTRYETNEYRKNLELARKEQEYKDKVLAQTKEFSIALGISAVVMLCFLVLLLRSNASRKWLIKKLKKKNNEFLKAKEEAERLSQLKTQFFSTVSHELRTPLYGVIGLTSLLLEENDTKEKEEDLKSLKFSADYLLALINDVLQMSKMESNLMQLENTSFNIRDLMRRIVKSFEFSRNQRGNTIELFIDDDIPDLLIGDSVRLSQIIMNLAGNSIKFTENGTVWIKASYRDCEEGKCLIYFEVGDTGMGIPQDKQQEIFEEFSQLNTTNYSYQGTGLGLPIVKKLLHLFGSEIHLESEAGKGSLFSFEIMFLEDKDAGQKESSGKAGKAAIGAFARKALIVDDNKINQIVTQRILEKKDFRCEVVGSGLEAIAILKQKQFDLVLMDVNMPGMNGMETTQKIREFDKNIPIIALTAVEVEEMKEKILASGMNDIIVKPYDTSVFYHTISRNTTSVVLDS